MLTEYAAAPNLNLSPEEKRVFGLLFKQADTDGIGVVTGENAVKFFEKTGIEPRILGEVGDRFVANTADRVSSSSCLQSIILIDLA